MPTREGSEVVEYVAHVLGGPRVLRERVQSWGDLERVVRAGLPKQSLRVVAQHAAAPGVSMTEFVYSVVPSATFKRRSKLTAAESERTERLARVVALAERLWQDSDQARAFLNRPHPLLDGKSPIVMARTELGARRVEQLVHEIEHGLPL